MRLNLNAFKIIGISILLLAFGIYTSGIFILSWNEYLLFVGEPLWIVSHFCLTVGIVILSFGIYFLFRKPPS